MNPEVNYLRISLTDRCQLRCVYCMPPEGIEKVAHGEILTFEEIIRVVSAVLGLGITRFRLTGGEPLVRKGIIDLVGRLGELTGVEDLSLTSNGLELARYAAALRAGGVTRINISLDSLDPHNYRRITRGGDVNRALQGIEAARQAGFREVKLNTVIMRGINEEDIFPLLDFAGEKRLPIRFIEMMPVTTSRIEGEERFLSAGEIKRRVEAKFSLKPLEVSLGCGPAEYYRGPGYLTIGFIAPISHGFCSTCNRMRLTADGKIRPCLASDLELDLKKVLRDGAGEEEIRAVFRRAAGRKLFTHDFASKRLSFRKMGAIGG